MALGFSVLSNFTNNYLVEKYINLYYGLFKVKIYLLFYRKVILGNSRQLSGRAWNAHFNRHRSTVVEIKSITAVCGLLKPRNWLNTRAMSASAGRRRSFVCWGKGAVGLRYPLMRCVINV